MKQGKYFGKLWSRVWSAAMIVLILLAGVCPVNAAPVATPDGAPRMPKGAKNYITSSTKVNHLDGSKSTWENGMWTPDPNFYGDEDNPAPRSEFVLDGLSASDEYVMSFWSCFSSEYVSDWNGFIGLQYQKGKGNEGQKISVMVNLVQYFRYWPPDQNNPNGILGEAERFVDNATKKAAPKGENFKVDVHVKPTGGGKCTVSIYINNATLVTTWSPGQKSVTGMDVFAPSFILSASMAESVWGIRVYKVDNAATSFEPDAVKPASVTTTAATTPTTAATTTTTTAASAETSGESTSGTAAQTSGNTSDTSTQAGDPGSGNLRWIILTIVIGVVLIGGGVSVFFILKKVKD